MANYLRASQPISACEKYYSLVWYILREINSVVSALNTPSYTDRIGNRMPVDGKFAKINLM